MVNNWKKYRGVLEILTILASLATIASLLYSVHIYNENVQKQEQIEKQHELSFLVALDDELRSNLNFIDNFHSNWDFSGKKITANRASVITLQEVLSQGKINDFQMEVLMRHIYSELANVNNLLDYDFVYISSSVEESENYKKLKSDRYLLADTTLQTLKKDIFSARESINTSLLELGHSINYIPA